LCDAPHDFYETGDGDASTKQHITGLIRFLCAGAAPAEVLGRDLVKVIPKHIS
jgi:hypothetical protein